MAAEWHDLSYRDLKLHWYWWKWKYILKRTRMIRLCDIMLFALIDRHWWENIHKFWYFWSFTVPLIDCKWRVCAVEIRLEPEFDMRRETQNSCALQTVMNILCELGELYFPSSISFVSDLFIGLILVTWVSLVSLSVNYLVLSSPSSELCCVDKELSQSNCAIIQSISCKAGLSVADVTG